MRGKARTRERTYICWQEVISIEDIRRALGLPEYVELKAVTNESGEFVQIVANYEERRGGEG